MKEQKKIKLRKSKCVMNKYINKTNVYNHIFIGTEGEDIPEANLSFLIELLGSKLYETYVDEILNISSKKKIKVVAVPHPSTPPKEALIKGHIRAYFMEIMEEHIILVRLTENTYGIHINKEYKQTIQTTFVKHLLL